MVVPVERSLRSQLSHNLQSSFNCQAKFLEETATVAEKLREEEAKVQELFNVVDRDGDGFVNFEEFVLLLRENDLGNMPQDEFREMCKSVGAETARGLGKEQFMKVFAQCPSEKIEEFALVMRATGGDAEAAAKVPEERREKEGEAGDTTAVE